MLATPSPDHAHRAYPHQEETWSMVVHVVTGMLPAIKNGIKVAEMAFENFQCLRELLSATLACEHPP